MKLGTDAVLLGALTDPREASAILDVGTGCGIIALMMAQKSAAKIDAIDPDANSINDALQNFSNSPWGNRLTASLITLRQFAKQNKTGYDLILSNPPYFSGSLKPGNPARALAKHDSGLRFFELIRDASHLMKTEGRLSVIIPYIRIARFTEIAGRYRLFLSKQINIIPKPSKPANLAILEFGKSVPDMIKTEYLSIRNDDNTFTNEYRNLTAEFYLNF
jgi:tRNA1Val (adenine37-N6)-methyltransferase